MDIFWIHNTSTIHVILSYAKEMVRKSMDAVRAFPLPVISDFPVGDEVEMGTALKMLEKSLSNSKNIRNYLQFKKVRHLYALSVGIYSATEDSHSSIYSFNYHSGSILHMYEGVMQSSLVDRFSKEMKNRIS